MDAQEKDRVLAECEELMPKAGYAETKIEQFCNFISDILQEIIDNPEDREVRYQLRKRIDRVELRIDVSGDRIDPLNEGKGAEDRRFQDAVNHVLFNPENSISVSYPAGWNRLVVKSPSRIANSQLLNDPMVKAMLLGIVAGVICRFIPQELSGVFLDQIAAPIMTTLMNLLMGIMGPVFFLFIIVAVGSLGTMDELAKTGKVIVKRFILVSLWVAVLTTAVALVFFPVFGESAESIDVPAVENALLGVLPTNLVSPFAEGQIPQIILLGVVFGVALLMMGESAKPVKDALAKIKEWRWA